MRKRLREHCGKCIHVTAEYHYRDRHKKRGHLIRIVQDQEGEILAGHLWVKGSVPSGIKKGTVVIVSGNVEKYGKLGRKAFEQEDYGLFDVKMKCA